MILAPMISARAPRARGWHSWWGQPLARPLKAIQPKTSQKSSARSAIMYANPTPIMTISPSRSPFSKPLATRALPLPAPTLPSAGLRSSRLAGLRRQSPFPTCVAGLQRQKPTHLTIRSTNGLAHRCAAQFAARLCQVARAKLPVSHGWMRKSPMPETEFWAKFSTPSWPHAPLQ